MSSSSESSYAGSEASVGSSGMNPVEAVASEIVATFDAGRLDRALVLHAQLSGQVHAQSGELAELQALVTQKMPQLKASVARARTLLGRIYGDLEKLHRRVRALDTKARASHPIEYAQAVESEPRTRQAET